MTNGSLELARKGKIKANWGVGGEKKLMAWFNFVKIYLEEGSDQGGMDNRDSDDNESGFEVVKSYNLLKGQVTFLKLRLRNFCFVKNLWSGRKMLSYLCQ